MLTEKPSESLSIKKNKTKTNSLCFPPSEPETTAVDGVTVFGNVSGNVSADGLSPNSYPLTIQTEMLKTIFLCV